MVTVIGATYKTGLFKAEGNSIVVDYNGFVEDGNVCALSKNDLKGKRLQVKFYRYVRNEDTDEMEKEYLYEGGVDDFDSK